MSTISSVSSINETYELNSKKEVFDARNVLMANIEAIGGKSHVLDDRTSYTTGKITIEDADYTFKEWDSKPSKNRRDIYSDDYLLYSSGDNGISIWSLDKQTNTLNSYIDSGTDDRLFRDSFGDLEYLTESNTEFKVDDMGYETIDGEKHYVVKITNTYNDDEVYQYINTNTLMMSKSKSIDGDNVIETSYSDFKDVSGVLKPYTKIIENLTSESKQEVTIENYKRNIVIHDDTYAIPEKNIMGTYEFKK